LKFGAGAYFADKSGLCRDGAGFLSADREDGIGEVLSGHDIGERRGCFSNDTTGSLERYGRIAVDNGKLSLLNCVTHYGTDFHRLNLSSFACPYEMTPRVTCSAYELSSKNAAPSGLIDPLVIRLFLTLH